jgi:hypothetical protein
VNFTISIPPFLMSQPEHLVGIERFVVPKEAKRLFDAATPFIQKALDTEYENGVYDIVQDVLNPGEDAVLIVRLHTHSDVEGCLRLLESAYAAMPESIRRVRQHVEVWASRDYIQGMKTPLYP